MSFLWFDFETFGTNPVVDRPCQFAAIRTDDDLETEDEAVSIFCAPADDVLPNPYACLVTGITPQKAEREGVNEATFADAIYGFMSKPDTCCVGFNNLRFDDEVTRHLFYRNFIDPYAREWKNGNTRWDLINLARACYALRPEGIEWPPVPGFRLEDLTAANNIEHGDAHDALADARATLELARLIRRAQPRLLAWSLRLRSRKFARAWVTTQAGQPFVHTSGRISSTRGCTTIVYPLAWHPDIDSQLIAFDLMADPTALIEESPDAIEDLIFTPSADLPDDLERLPVKTIKINASPMVAPLGVLQNSDLARISLDMDRCLSHADLLRRNAATVQEKISKVFHREFDAGKRDPEHSLYSGGFFSPHDRKLINDVHGARPQELASGSWPFEDERLATLLLRYRARNWPETLDQGDWDHWQSDRSSRLAAPPGGDWYGIEAFTRDLEQARVDASDNPQKQAILDEVESWQQKILPET